MVAAVSIRGVKEVLKRERRVKTDRISGTVWAALWVTYSFYQK